MEEIRWYEKLDYTETKDIIKEKLQNMSRDFVAIGFYLKLNENLDEDGFESVEAIEMYEQEELPFK